MFFFRGLQELVGIIVGHLYFFLMFKYPQEMGGPQLIQTPQILLVLILFNINESSTRWLIKLNLCF